MTNYLPSGELFIHLPEILSHVQQLHDLKIYSYRFYVKRTSNKNQ